MSLSFDHWLNPIIFPDLVGIIPNVIVISMCITAIAVTKLNRTKKAAEKDHED